MDNGSRSAPGTDEGPSRRYAVSTSSSLALCADRTTRRQAGTPCLRQLAGPLLYGRRLHKYEHADAP